MPIHRDPVLAPAVVARVSIRYDETKADLVHDEQFEAVLFPLGDHLDVNAVIQVDYNDRDLRTEPPIGGVFRLTDARSTPKRTSRRPNGAFAMA